MSLAVDADQRALAESVAAFARKVAPLSQTREHLHRYAVGSPPLDVWTALCQQGLHSMHLPAAYAGDECGLATLAVVVEELSAALFPGPYLSTVTASALVMLATSGAHPLLEDFSAGMSGAVVTGSRMRATRGPNGWEASGQSDPALGLPGARRVVVRAEIEGEPGASLWFWLTAADANTSVQVISDEAVDLTRSVGHLDLEAYPVGAEQVLEGIDPAAAELWTTALAAAEATGLCTWLLRTAVEYIGMRKQFGRAIGSFQAVQHKAALMLVRAEVTAAAAWDAARAESHTVDQQRLAAAHAALTAIPAAVEQALECVSLLGGIGFTWEHDAHLYWRRAISLAAAYGSPDAWARELGERSLIAERDFSFVTPQSLPELRGRVGAVLGEVVALPEDEMPSAGWAPARGAARRARLAANGLVATHYPLPYGLGAGPAEQAVIAEEFDRCGLAQPELGIGGWILPTLLEHGSTEQRDRFVADTLQGDIIWCQLFSEPGAGSDLAGLSTTATKVEGGWILNGQKVWNSQAQDADWAVCLARTDSAVPKHAGLT